MTTEDLPIGQIARASSTSVRALRHYERKGLLQARRAANGYRLFPAATIAQVRQIRRMLNLGFSLDEIAQFPHCMLEGQNQGLCPVAAEAHERRLAEIEAQIEALERQRAALVQALRASVL